jgi:hypothetical protein
MGKSRVRTNPAPLPAPETLQSPATRSRSLRPECHSTATLGKAGIRFYIRKLLMNWEPPYGIEP